MYSLSNAESRRVSDLLAAFEDRQITLDELHDGLRPVSAETLQMVGTWGTVRDAFEPGTPRLHSAHVILRTMASSLRCRC